MPEQTQYLTELVHVVGLYTALNTSFVPALVDKVVFGLYFRIYTKNSANMGFTMLLEQQ